MCLFPWHKSPGSPQHCRFMRQSAPIAPDPPNPEPRMRRTKAEALNKPATICWTPPNSCSTSAACPAPRWPTSPAAGSRAAVYWHFTDKEDRSNPCERTCHAVDHLTEQLAGRTARRRAGGICAATTWRCLKKWCAHRAPGVQYLWNKYECPDDNSPVMQTPPPASGRRTPIAHHRAARAREQGELRHPGELDDPAVILQNRGDGLIELWLADPNRFAIETCSRAAWIYLDGGVRGCLR